MMEHEGIGRMVQCIRRARRTRKLPKQFRAADAKRVCPDWDHWQNFLPKHRKRNPGCNTEHFIRHERGLYSLICDCEANNG